MPTDIRPLKPTSNEIILDRIRYEGSNDYQRRIPEATKAGVQDTMKALTKYRPLWNEFEAALINRIGSVLARNISWSNPLSIFKQGMLNQGDTIEEIQVGLIKARNYDPDRESLEKELFGTHRAEVQANFHKINRMDRYDITVNSDLLRRAFLTGTEMGSFVGQLMEAPSTSDQWDEFLLMCQLFPEYSANGGFFKVKTPDVSAPDSTEADAKKLLRIVRMFADKLPFVSTKYNAAGMPMHAKKDELILFCTPEVKAAIDVEALAAAFNVDYAAMPSRMIVIPEENFGIPGLQAILTTESFFVVADNLLETTSQYNAATLSNNYFLHHWEVISASRFTPAILFTSLEGDEEIKLRTPVTGIEAITVTDILGNTPTELERGEVYAYNSDAVTTPADGVNNGVRWAVSGNTSNRTYITQAGVLHVGFDEEAASLTVTATTTWIDEGDNMKDGESATKTLNVAGVSGEEWPKEIEVSDILIEGSALTPAFDPDTFAYTFSRETGTTGLTSDDITVTGPDRGDLVISINATTVVVYSPSSPGDPVYTVTVSDPTP